MFQPDQCGYPDSVTTIGKWAFRNCTGLISVTIGTNVVTIGEEGFKNCNSLESVAIPDSVTSIGRSAFNACANLTSVTIPDSVTSIGDYAFYWCANLTRLMIGNGAAAIGVGTFYSCTNLASVTIPDNITAIADKAFQLCANLTSVFCQGSAPALGGALVFDGATNATIYYLPGTTGWGATFGGRPTELLNPQMQNLGVSLNQFGFTISGPSNLVVSIEACTNLVYPIWTALETNTLTGGSAQFSDAQWTNYPTRFYRFSLP